MIQDRLTAKFQSAKPAKHRETQAKVRPVKRSAKAPATDRFTKGRVVPGSFWI